MPNSLDTNPRPASDCAGCLLPSVATTKGFSTLWHGSAARRESQPCGVCVAAVLSRASCVSVARGIPPSAHKRSSLSWLVHSSACHWQGCAPTVARAMVVNAAQLASYSQAKEAFKRYAWRHPIFRHRHICPPASGSRFASINDDADFIRPADPPFPGTLNSRRASPSISAPRWSAASLPLPPPCQSTF